MIDVHFAATPNGLKIHLAVHELGLEHRLIPVKLSAGEQFRPEFLAISPNNKIPAIVDHAPADGGAPLSVFESGAILQYLAEKCGALLGRDARERVRVLEWLTWQVAGLGPMAGQCGWFRTHSPVEVPAALERYGRELTRLYGVLDRQLAKGEFIVGDALSIADLACYPWIVPHAGHGQRLGDHPHLSRWFAAMSARPATGVVYAGVEDVYARPRWGLVEREASLPTRAL